MYHQEGGLNENSLGVVWGYLRGVPWVYAQNPKNQALWVTRASHVILAVVKSANSAAVAMARLRGRKLSPERRREIAAMGGIAGGEARAAALSPKRRREIARHAAEARWAKKGAH